MTNRLLNRLGFKRIPPFFYVLALPYYIVLFSSIPFILIGFLSAWFLGLWKCELCKRIYWAREERHEIRIGHGDQAYFDHICSSCHIAEKLVPEKETAH